MKVSKPVRQLGRTAQLLEPPGALVRVCSPRQQIVVGDEHANAPGRVDWRAVPPPHFNGLDDAPAIVDPMIRVVRDGDNSNLAVMSTNPRALAARECSGSSRSIDDKRYLASASHTIDAEIDFPSRAGSRRARQRCGTQDGCADQFACPREIGVKSWARQIQSMLARVEKVVHVVRRCGTPVRLHAGAREMGI